MPPPSSADQSGDAGVSPTTQVRLIRPDPGRHAEFLDALADMEPEHVPGLMMPSRARRDVGDPQVFRTWVRDVLAEQDAVTEQGWVTHSAFWITDGAAILGFLDLRHTLNDSLREVGGHIGYSVRRSRRGHGIATRALALGLAKAHEAGIDAVLITCDDDNLASATVIERNGGRLQDVKNGKRRYWITQS